LGLRPPVVDLPPQGFILHDVTVVNPGMDRKAGQSIKVIGSTITDISSSEGVGPETYGDRRFAGAYVLPGLMEMHVHAPFVPVRGVPPTSSMTERSCLLYLRYGVTTLRDVGNFELIWEVQKKFDREDFPCPRLFSCGRLLDGEGSKIGEIAQVIRTSAEARAAVHEA
jgi:imidazolonepropionase-like amidohydrolase